MFAASYEQNIASIAIGLAQAQYTSVTGINAPIPFKQSLPMQADWKEH